MANSEHLAKILEGVEAWNEWRKANTEIVPDLSWACLHRAKLSRANLSEANLRRASLRGAYLGGAAFRDANLRGTSLCGAYLGGADLRQANLYLADFSEADLTRAGLSGAHLNWAHFNRANLRGANLTGAYIGETAFGDNDLSVVKGLETVEHDGPSTIGIDTIYRSHGNIPLAFLRGAGVPENFIESIPSLLALGVNQFFSSFISYSTKDQGFAERLHADLQDKGVRCWFAPHDIQAGKKIHEQIDLAIRTHEKLLLILSPNSMSSEWVKTEIRKARKRERTEKKRVLFPVRLVSFEAIQDWELFDADEGKDLAVEIREYYIPDFSDWKNHDPYAEGLKNLLRDLKAEQPKAA